MEGLCIDLCMDMLTRRHVDPIIGSVLGVVLLGSLHAQRVHTLCTPISPYIPMVPKSSTPGDVGDIAVQVLSMLSAADIQHVLYLSTAYPL
jgi:hypothetical protein